MNTELVWTLVASYMIYTIFIFIILVIINWLIWLWEQKKKNKKPDWRAEIKRLDNEIGEIKSQLRKVGDK